MTQPEAQKRSQLKSILACFGYSSSSGGNGERQHASGAERRSSRPGLNDSLSASKRDTEASVAHAGSAKHGSGQGSASAVFVVVSWQALVARDLRVPAASDKAAHALIPVHCSDPTLVAFGIQHVCEVNEVLRGLCEHDSAIAAFVSRLVAARAKGPFADMLSISPGASGTLLPGQQQSIVHMSCKSATWMSTWPAVELTWGFGPTQAPQSEDLSKASILSQLSVAVTVADTWGGHVLYQNNLSTRYHGRVGAARSDGTSSDKETRPWLEHLFSLEPSELPGMLTAVRAGQTWRKVIKAPVQGHRPANTQQGSQVLLCQSASAAGFLAELLTTNRCLCDEMTEVCHRPTDNSLRDTSHTISQSTCRSTPPGNGNWGMSFSRTEAGSNPGPPRLETALSLSNNSNRNSRSLQFAFTLDAPSRVSMGGGGNGPTTPSMCRQQPAGSLGGSPMSLVDLPDALATSGWRHARVRSNGVRRKGQKSERDAAPTGSWGSPGPSSHTPRIALVSISNNSNPNSNDALYTVQSVNATSNPDLTVRARAASLTSAARARALAGFATSDPAGKSLPSRLSTQGNHGTVVPPPRSQAYTFAGCDRDLARVPSADMSLMSLTDARSGANSSNGKANLIPVPLGPKMSDNGRNGDHTLCEAGGDQLILLPRIRTKVEEDSEPCSQIYPVDTVLAAIGFLESLVVGAEGSSVQLLPESEDTSTYQCDESHEPQHVFFEICASPLPQPGTNTTYMMLVQTDVTLRVAAEKSLAELTDGQLSLLEGMFPRHVLHHMTVHGHAMHTSAFAASLENLAAKHEGVTVLFMDVVGFTQMSKEVEPYQVMKMLSQLFTLMDELVDEWGLYKIETAGDAYLIAGNLMTRDDDGFLILDSSPTNTHTNTPHAPATTDTHLLSPPHNRGQSHPESAFMLPGPAGAVMQAAARAPQAPALTGAQLGAMRVFCLACEALRVVMPHTGEPVQIRVGIHTGDLVSGVVGTKLPKFGCFGDTMNTAARMEQTSRPGCIQLTVQTRELLPPQLDLTATDGVEVKGKGVMHTYIWNSQEDKTPASVMKTMGDQCRSRRASHCSDTVPTRQPLHPSTTTTATQADIPMPALPAMPALPRVPSILTRAVVSPLPADTPHQGVAYIFPVSAPPNSSAVASDAASKEVYGAACRPPTAPGAGAPTGAASPRRTRFDERSGVRDRTLSSSYMSSTQSASGKFVSFSAVSIAVEPRSPRETGDAEKVGPAADAAGAAARGRPLRSRSQSGCYSSRTSRVVPAVADEHTHN